MVRYNKHDYHYGYYRSCWFLFPNTTFRKPDVSVLRHKNVTTFQANTTHTLAVTSFAVQWQRLTRSKGPNCEGTFPPPALSYPKTKTDPLSETLCLDNWTMNYVQNSDADNFDRSDIVWCIVMMKNVVRPTYENTGFVKGNGRKAL
jgi:hypothetical protein